MTFSAPQLEQQGYHIFRETFPANVTRAMQAECDRLTSGASGAVSIKKKDAAFAARNVLAASEELRSILGESFYVACIKDILQADAFAVRGIVFDKPFRANWFVPWHQDLTIAIKERRAIVGFENWTVKAGIPHARPPAAILSRMITLRIHLDNTITSNGALQIIPGSHRNGIVSPSEIPDYVRRGSRVCEVGAGGAMLMRPLLLHSSRASDTSVHRRVLHIEFSCDELPEPLEWKWRVPL